MPSKKLLLAALAAAASFVACDPKPAQQAAPDTGPAPVAAQGDLPAPPDVAAPPADAEKTKSGLASKRLAAGTGTVSPQRQDLVKVHYTGWTTDGKMFDSSVKRGAPAEFPLGGVIKGWTEGVGMMVVGEKRRLWIPEALAYAGQAGAPKGMLVFDVELLDIKFGPKPIPAPADVAAPPADAELRNGLHYKRLSAGKDDKHPSPEDTVTVHYTGWTTDGVMFDSSVTRGQPAKFPLNRVIPGWTEGLQLMTVGEKARLWIPEAMAYQGRPGAPAGLLVFDVELISFVAGPKAPKDVAKPPKSAKKTKTGLSYVVLKKGTGKARPGPTAKVSVHYSGWTTDGKMFDSSVVRGEPAKFALNQVIPGWTEGLQLMVPGEKTLFWIPEELAYKGQPGRPQGMLVFEVELLDVEALQ